MRNYRDVGKTGVSFLTAFASGTSLDQDATGEGYLLSPGLYTNLLLPYNELENVRIPNTQLNINPTIEPNIVADDMNYSSNHFTVENFPSNQNVLANQNLGNTKYFTVENYPSNQNILANQNLGNTKYTYEVLLYENS